MDRDVTHQPDNAEPQSWPVLAQLPRLGYAASESERDVEPPRVGVHSTHGGRQIHAVDPPHVARGYDGPSSSDLAVKQLRAELASAPEPPASHRRLRIDARASQLPPARHQHAEPESLSGAVLRLRDALAPYLGLAAAAAFAVSGALLYWSAFGEPQAVQSPANGAVENNTWASELPAPETALPSPQEPAIDPHPPVTAARPDTGTRVADATASQQEIPAAPAAATPTAKAPTAPASGGPSLTSATPDVAQFNKSAAAPTSQPIEEPITPTPQTATFPTTPYATFWFEPAAVAQRPISTDSPAPR